MADAGRNVAFGVASGGDGAQHFPMTGKPAGFAFGAGSRAGRTF